MGGAKTEAEPKPVEFRAGLVLYGGVSLAVYMGGVCAEFLEVVKANRDPKNRYRDLLEKLKGTFVIDVISGTSAGGVNGVFLARALTCDGDMAAMDTLWQEQGDFAALTNWGSQVPESVLNGVTFQRELEKAMRQMGRDADDASLVKALDLHVTTTDIGGNYWKREDQLKHEILGRDHARVFTLKYRDTYDLAGGQAGYKQNDFRSYQKKNWEETSLFLAKLARTTAAFPGAFEPVDFKGDEVAATGEGGDGRSQIWMTDGGVLQNKPFAPTLKTIFHRTADTRVERLLFYVEPALEDAQILSDQDRSDKPNAFQVAFSGLITVPMYQGIGQHLKAIDEHNGTVEHLRNVLAGLEQSLMNHAKTERAKKEAAAGAEKGTVKPPIELKPKQTEPALSVVPPGVSDLGNYHFRPYALLRAQEVQAGLKARLREMLLAQPQPAGENHLKRMERAEERVKAIVDSLEQELKAKSDNLADFLEKYDLPYHLRRLHYLIEQCGLLYFTPPEQTKSEEAAERVKNRRAWEAAVTREEARLWHAIDRLRSLEWALWNKVDVKDPDHAFSLWGKDLESPGTVLEAVEKVMAEWKKTEQQTFAAVESLKNLASQDHRYATAGHTTPDFEHIREFYWMRDTLLLPLQMGTTLGERDEISWVRISPFDADTVFRADPKSEEKIRYEDRLKAGWRKLAGDTLNNFGGFMSWRWRANDFMWGRLDAVDLILQHLVRVAEDSRRYTDAELTAIKTTAHETRMAAFKAILKSHLHKYGKEQLAEFVWEKEALQFKTRLQTQQGIEAQAALCMTQVQSLVARAQAGAALQAEELVQVSSQLHAPLADLEQKIRNAPWQTAVSPVIQQALGAVRKILDSGAGDGKGEEGTVLGKLLETLANVSQQQPAKLADLALPQRKLGKAVYTDKLVEDMDWEAMHLFLTQYYDTGTEEVASLHPGVPAHVGIDVADNVRRLVGGMVDKSKRPVPPFVQKLAQAVGYPVQWLARVVKPVIPRPGIGQDDRRPSRWGLIAAVVTALPLVLGYLANWFGWGATFLAVGSAAALAGLFAIGYSWWRKGAAPEISVAPGVLLWLGAVLVLFGSARSLAVWTIPGTAVTPLQAANVLGMGLLLLWGVLMLGVLASKAYFITGRPDESRRRAHRALRWLALAVGIVLAVPVVLVLTLTVLNQIRAAGLPGAQDRQVTTISTRLDGAQDQGFPVEGIARTPEGALLATTLDGYVLQKKGLGPWAPMGDRFGTAKEPGAALGIVAEKSGRILTVAIPGRCGLLQAFSCEGGLYEWSGARWNQLAAIPGSPNGLAVVGGKHVYVSTEPFGWQILHGELKGEGQIRLEWEPLKGALIGTRWWMPNGLATARFTENGQERTSLVVAEMLSGKLLEIRLTPEGKVDPNYEPAELAQVPGFVDGVAQLDDGRIAMSANNGYIYLYSPGEGKVTATLKVDRAQAPANLLQLEKNKLHFAAIGQMEFFRRGKKFPGTGLGEIVIDQK